MSFAAACMYNCYWNKTQNATSTNMFAGSEPPKYLVITKYLFNQIFINFFKLLKTSFNWKLFVDWPIRNLFFSAKSKHMKKLTADIWWKKYLVIHGIWVVRIPRTCYIFATKNYRFWIRFLHFLLWFWRRHFNSPYINSRKDVALNYRYAKICG